MMFAFNNEKSVFEMFFYLNRKKIFLCDLTQTKFSRLRIKNV